MTKAFSIDSPKTVSYIDTDDGEYKVVYVGLCGSDRRVYRGTMPFVQYPRIPGHEVVLRTNDGYAVVKPYIACGKCFACERGAYNRCENNQTYGVQIDGLLRETVTVNKDLLLELPATIKPWLYVMAEPLGVCLNAIDKTVFTKKTTFTVIGNGQLGQIFKTLFEELCVDCTVVGRADPIPKNSEIVIECSGTALGFSQCMESVCNGGEVILLGHSQDKCSFSESDIVKKELTIQGSRNCTTKDMLDAISIIRKNEDAWQKNVAKVFPFSKAKEAFKHFDKNSSDGKVIIEM